MTITLGELVSDLFGHYEREFHDPELAAVATEVKLAEILELRASRPVAHRPAARGRT